MKNNGLGRTIIEYPVSESTALTDFPSRGQWSTCTAACRSNDNIENEEEKHLTNTTFKVFIWCLVILFSRDSVIYQFK